MAGVNPVSRHVRATWVPRGQAAALGKPPGGGTPVARRPPPAPASPLQSGSYNLFRPIERGHLIPKCLVRGTGEASVTPPRLVATGGAPHQAAALQSSVGSVAARWTPSRVADELKQVEQVVPPGLDLGKPLTQATDL